MSTTTSPIKKVMGTFDSFLSELKKEARKRAAFRKYCKSSKDSEEEFETPVSEPPMAPGATGYGPKRTALNEYMGQIIKLYDLLFRYRVYHDDNIRAVAAGGIGIVDVLARARSGGEGA